MRRVSRDRAARGKSQPRLDRAAGGDETNDPASPGSASNGPLRALPEGRLKKQSEILEVGRTDAVQLSDFFKLS